MFAFWRRALSVVLCATFSTSIVVAQIASGIYTITNVETGWIACDIPSPSSAPDKINATDATSTCSFKTFNITQLPEASSMPDIFAITSLGRRTGVKNNTLWAGINTLSPSNWTITPRSGTDDQFTITNATEGYWTAPSVPNAQIQIQKSEASEDFIYWFLQPA